MCIRDRYADFCEQVLAIPVIKGRKTDKEKFAGAEATYTIESLMHDGKALQSGTSHNFGDGFAKAFGIQYTDKENKLQYVHQTSWGMTTRMIGALIMVPVSYTHLDVYKRQDPDGSEQCYFPLPLYQSAFLQYPAESLFFCRLNLRFYFFQRKQQAF